MMVKKKLILRCYINIFFTESNLKINLWLIDPIKKKIFAAYYLSCRWIMDKFTRCIR